MYMCMEFYVYVFLYLGLYVCVHIYIYICVRSRVRVCIRPFARARVLCISTFMKKGSKGSKRNKNGRKK